MRSLARPAFFVALLLGAMLSGATAQIAQKQGTGAITGRISLGEKAMPNVAVALFREERAPEREAVAKTATDLEGRYRLTGVPAGRYNVVAIAPTMIGPNEGMYGDPGRTITIAEGETVENIDFPLVRGGVITGRVTDADGAPVIGERIELKQSGPQGHARGFSSFNPFMYETDDRGVYRLFGIPPGRYTISVGESPESGGLRFGAGGKGYYARTFHPGVTEESKAGIIEIAEGSEASNVDITLGRKSQSFAATGRIVDEHDKPVVGVPVGHGTILKGENRMGGYGWGTISDANGRFRIDGLVPGRYAAFVWTEGANMEGYTDPAVFEITEKDISGLELKLRRGASVSGVAVIEGTTDKSILARLTQLSVGVGVDAEALGVPSYANVKVAPDGSFRATGLRPGKARIYLGSYPPLKGFSLARVERDGIPLREIEITPGAQVTGLRVVFEYGTGSIRGLVKVEKGPVPEDMRMSISVRRRGETNEFVGQGAQVDSRGRFTVEGVSTGEYELILQTYIVDTGTPRNLAPITKNVTVTNGVESEVIFTVDLYAKQPEGGNHE